MSQTIQALLRHLRGAPGPSGNATDADLLDRFVRNRDGTAFTALVVRHGPMVLGVCQRLLHDPHDAEDAFQATFLVLDRRADTLRRSDSIGTWLYGVACRTAAHARVDRARRRIHERRATAMPPDEPTPAVEWADLRPILDEEIQRLPDECRVPVVLCYLGGKTYDEAATEIGCPKGTVATRLAKARELLRDRLSGRGVTLPAAVLTAVLAENARAAVAAPLLYATVEAATTSVASVGVINLTERVLTTMSGSKLKTAVTLLVVVGLLAVAGTGLFALAQDVPGNPAPPLSAEPKPEDAKPVVPAGLWQTGWLRVHEEGKDGRVLLFRPDGSMRAETAVHKIRRAALSPDGTHVLSVRGTGDDAAIFMVDVEGKFDRQVSIGRRIGAHAPCWAPDGKHIAFLGKVDGQWQVHEMGGNGGDHRQVTDLPNGAGMPAYAPDGRLSYLSFHKEEKDQKADLVLGVGTDAKTVVTKTQISHYAWSPDGKTIAYGKPGALVFHEVESGKEHEVAFPQIRKRLDVYAARKISWCPDGRAVACVITFPGDRQQEGAKLFGDDELFVIPRDGQARWFQPRVSVQHLEWIELPARAASGVKGLLKTVEGFRKELPPPANIGELNGFSIAKDGDGQHVLMSHLGGIARRLHVKTKGECMVLLSYLNDRDIRIRYIAAEAIEKVVGAYPGGMSLNDMTEIDTEGHRELIRRFAEKIDKLTD